MRILAELKEIKLIEDYHNVDGLIVNTPFSISPNKSYLDDLEDIIAWAEGNNIEVFLRMDGIITEYELDEVKKILDQYDELNIIYSDFAIYTYYKRKNRLKQLYYFAQTYLCNYEDVKFYTSKGVHVLVSNELNANEINTIIEHNPDNVGVLAYGYFPIFYTKREIGSLYNEYIKQEYHKDLLLEKNHPYELKEELRDDHYKFIELEKGSIIYSCKKMMITDDIDLEKLDFIFLSNAFISDEENKEMIDFYKEIKLKQEMNQELFDSLSKNSFKSFLYKTNEILQEKNND